MAYQRNIPLANDSFSKSQADLNGNFQSLGTSWPINHVAFDITNTGKHTLVQLPTVQGSDPGTAAGEVALYTKTGITTVPALFFQGQSNAAVAAGGFTEAAASITGWTRLPSGILLKWGITANLNAGTPTPIVFPTGATIPAFANIFVVLATPISAVNYGAVAVLALTTLGFTATFQGSSSFVQATYLALGN